MTLAALAAATIEGGAAGWTDRWVLGGFAVFAVAGACFIAIERRGSQPMLPLSLFGNSTFRATTLIGLLVNVCFYGLIFIFSLLFQREQGFSALKTGLAFLPMTASIMAANLLSERLTKRLGVRASILLGLGLMAAGCLGLLGITATTSYWAMAIQLLVLGAGLGLIVPPMTSALLGSVDRSRSGIAAGTLFAMRQSGSVIGVALFGSLLADRFVTGLHIALVISLAVLALGGLAALEIGARSRRAPANLPAEGH